MLQLNELLPLEQREPYWTIPGSEHEGLPDESRYVIFEYYCENPSCDCQNLVAVICLLGQDKRPTGKSVASVDYDWSTKEKACRPKLNENSPRTPLAKHLLKAYKCYVHSPDYVDHVKKDYGRIKELSAGRYIKNNVINMNSDKKIGRNDSCRCGSGKKYKKCCLTEA